MFTRILLALALPVCLSLGAAEINVGSTKDEVLKEWGKPKSSYQVGKEEVFTYEGGTRVEFFDGKVEKIKNREAMTQRPAAPAAATGTAATSPPVAAAAPLDLPPPVFNGVPKATIVTDPNFRTDGTWGGESDGKTIGIDGKPLADHKIYSIDCYHFLQRVERGGQQLVQGKDRERLSALAGIMRARDDASREREAASFLRRFSLAYTADPWLPLAQLTHRMNQARNSYDQGEGQLNYLEQLKIKDRIDLDKAPNAEGAKWRAQMKDAIARMQQAREALLARYGHLYEAGRKQQEAEHAKIVASEAFAVTKADTLQLFAYGSFERTPMLEGLALASLGQTNLTAKPIFVPKGERVQVLETDTKDVPATATRAAMQLQLSKIKVKSDKFVQHDGRKIGAMTLQGWVLSRDLEATR
ncbi:MAG: hypothetical protein AB1705_10320 [Verrucomicrobiota bacterium]